MTWSAARAGDEKPVPADFAVTSPLSGKTFRLADAKGRWVALHFLLKTECPICLRTTREYLERGTNWPDVVQIFLKPDDAAEIRRWAGGLDEASRAQLPLYEDPGARWAKALGIPDGYEFHGERVHYPALIVLDGAGREVFRHVGKNNADRVPVRTFEARLAEWRKAGAGAPPR